MVSLQGPEDLPEIYPLGEGTPTLIDLTTREIDAEGAWASKLRGEVASAVGPYVTDAMVDTARAVIGELGPNANRNGRSIQAVHLGRIAGNRLLIGVTDDRPEWMDDERDKTPTHTPSDELEDIASLIEDPAVLAAYLKSQGEQGRGLGYIRERVEGPVHYSPEYNDKGRLVGKTVWVAPRLEYELAKPVPWTERLRNGIIKKLRTTR